MSDNWICCVERPRDADNKEGTAILVDVMMGAGGTQNVTMEVHTG